MTLVPINTRLGISSAEVSVVPGCANFSTGRDSPVRADWPRNRSVACKTRQSAGTMSPADSSTMSPGTRSFRSEERRVGKEGRNREARADEKEREGKDMQYSK